MDEPLEFDLAVEENKQAVVLTLPGQWGLRGIEPDIADTGEEVGVMQTVIRLHRIHIEEFSDGNETP